MTKIISRDQLPEFKPIPGYCGKMVHSENMTVMHWQIDADHEIPEHSHPHEQIVNLIQGQFVLVVDGESLHMQAGDIVVIPGDVPHSGRSVTDCLMIDVWHPVREDYKAAS